MAIDVPIGSQAVASHTACQMKETMTRLLSSLPEIKLTDNTLPLAQGGVFYHLFTNLLVNYTLGNIQVSQYTDICGLN